MSMTQDSVKPLRAEDMIATYITMREGMEALKEAFRMLFLTGFLPYKEWELFVDTTINWNYLRAENAVVNTHTCEPVYYIGKGWA